jgi:hypothetical protein
MVYDLKTPCAERLTTPPTLFMDIAFEIEIDHPF